MAGSFVVEKTSPIGTQEDNEFGPCSLGTLRVSRPAPNSGPRLGVAGKKWIPLNVLLVIAHQHGRTKILSCKLKMIK